MKLIEHGQKGLLTPVDDSKAMSDILLELLQTDPRQKFALADNGLQTVGDRFSKTVIVSQYFLFFSN